MKKRYDFPVIELIWITKEDIIATSPTVETDEGEEEIIFWGDM